jgi:predicted  nucleic acid-binding Zn-ribbon protein
MTDEERIEQIQTELRTWKQILKQTDEHMAAMRDGWESEDVTDLRDSCREHIGQLESELAEIEGREYTAPEKVADGDHVRVGDVEDALAELSEMASESDVTIADVLDAIADLSEDVSNLYANEGGE